MRKVLLAVAALLVPPGSAHAEELLADQVERLDIEQGEFEIEAQATIVASDADRAGEHVSSLTLEYGLSDSLLLGVELTFERETGEAMRLDTVGPQLKWMALDPDRAPVGFGVQSAVLFDAHTGEVGSETSVIAEMRRGRFGIAANLTFETEPGDWNEQTFAYAARADWRASHWLDLGVEAGGSLSGEAKGFHWLGPVATVRTGRGGPDLEVSLFAPLGDKAPGLQVRAALNRTM